MSVRFLLFPNSLYFRTRFERHPVGTEGRRSACEQIAEFKVSLSERETVNETIKQNQTNKNDFAALGRDPIAQRQRCGRRPWRLSDRRAEHDGLE
jgi:hypothetical protein